MSATHNVIHYCPIHGDLLAAPRSYRCGDAPKDHEYDYLTHARAIDEMDPVASEYPKIIERPYHLYAGQAEYIETRGEPATRTSISWTYESSHTSEHGAQVAADRLSARHQFVKIEKSGSSNE